MNAPGTLVQLEDLLQKEIFRDGWLILSTAGSGDTPLPIDVRQIRISIWRWFEYLVLESSPAKLAGRTCRILSAGPQATAAFVCPEVVEAVVPHILF